MFRKLCLLVPAVALVLGVFARPSEAAPHVPGAAYAGAPVRSGTIVVGFGFAWTGDNCAASADCLAWLKSGCNRAMAGKDPAVSSSIVDVRSLAGSRALRTLEITSATPRPWGYMTVELWGRGCQRVFTEGTQMSVTRSAEFRIPRRVAWMTVTTAGDHWLDSSFTGVALTWELR